MAYEDVQEARFKRDLVLPDVDGSVLHTVAGDWPTVAGLPNLLAAQRRRATTAPGDLVHRPDFGGGLPAYLETASDLGTRVRAANEIRANALRDRRIEEASASVALGETDGQVVVELVLRPRGEDPVSTTATLE